MGKINEYSALSLPASDDLLFIGDTSATPAYEIKNITVANLHKVANVAAEGPSGLSLKDDGTNYGIFIKDGGNVGIGTGAGSPNTFLELNSGARTATFVAGTPSTWTNMLLLNPTDTNTAAVGINFQVDNAFDSGSGAGIVGIKSHATNAQMDLAFITDPSGAGSAEAMRILHDGNVGVGTATPGDKVEIKYDNSGSNRALQLNFASDTAGVGMKFAYAGASKAYIQFIGSNYTTAARRDKLEILGTDGITFWPDGATADVVINTAGNLGVGTTTPTALVHIDSAVDNALYIHSTDVNKNARIKMALTSSGAGYIEDSPNYIAISGSSTFAANNCLQISKGGTTSGGYISIGGTLGSFDYAITTASNTPTQASFANTNGSRGYIYITNTTSPTAQTAVIFGNAETNSPRWMAGQFWTGSPSENYFSWNYLGGTALASNSPDSATFSPSSSALESNTAYCSQKGGLTSENTSVAFGHIRTNATSSTTILESTYNIESPVALNSSGVATITFNKTLTSDKYTVIANGWDGTRPLVGYASTKNDTDVAITFYRLDTGAVIDLTATSAIHLDFVVYGGTKSGVGGDVMLQTRLEKA
jgi:hypothetical protein